MTSAVVRRSRNDGDAPLERVELPDALLAAHANHLVAPIQRVLHHVLPELPRGPDDANPHRVPVVPFGFLASQLSAELAALEFFPQALEVVL